MYSPQIFITALVVFFTNFPKFRFFYFSSRISAAGFQSLSLCAVYET
jgi:hypothetical protein